MKPSSIIRQATRIALLLACSCCLSSCSMVTGLLGYLISLPGALIDAIIP